MTASSKTIITSINEAQDGVSPVMKFSQEHENKLDAYAFDLQKLAWESLPYERLNQLTIKVIFGVWRVRDTDTA